MLVFDVFDGGIQLGFEVTVVVLAEHFLVRHTADAFQYLSVKRSLERGSIDIMVHGHNVAERPAVCKVDIGYRLQRSGGTEGPLANDVACGQHLSHDHLFCLAHAFRVDVAKDDVGDILSGDVAMVLALWKDVIGRPDGMFQPPGTFLVARLEDLCLFVDIGADELIEVILITATVTAVVKNDAGQLLAWCLGDGGQPMVEEVGSIASRVFQDGCEGCH